MSFHRLNKNAISPFVFICGTNLMHIHCNLFWEIKPLAQSER